MRFFDQVVLAGLDYDVLQAMRGALEVLPLSVHTCRCPRESQVLDVLGGKIPPSDYVVLVSHGFAPTREGARFGEEAFGYTRLIGEVDGVWGPAEVRLVPENIPELVHLDGRTVISTGCNSGNKRYADAFLKAGCRAYIGPDGEVDAGALTLFVIAFFYHLLAEERPGGVRCSDEEAVMRASSIDPCVEGTHVFRYYAPEAANTMRDSRGCDQ